MSSPAPVRIKTAYLIREGKDPKQAYAEANSMQRAGRLTALGRYVRVGKKHRRPGR